MALPAGDRALMIAKVITEGEMRSHEEHMDELERSRRTSKGKR